MIILCVFILFTRITVSDFIFLHTRVYHGDRRGFSLLTRLALSLTDCSWLQDIICSVALALRFDIVCPAASRRLKPGVHTNDFAPIHGRRARIHTAPAESTVDSTYCLPQALCEYGRADRESGRNR